MIPKTKEKTFLEGYNIGGSNPFFLIAGPCVIESEFILDQVASKLKDICNKIGILFIFKSSYDKANRSSIQSFRGPGIKEGLEQLNHIKTKYKIPILTDVHSPSEVEQAAQVADIIQIPAFLCRQTDLITEAAKSGKWLNIKKGQFVAPSDALKIVEKVHSAGSSKILICERGYSFGYNNLVVDMRGIELLRKKGVYVVMDATHSTQLPGGASESGGQRDMAFPLARAAAAVGVDGFFMEVHPNPPLAKSDSSNQLFLKDAKNMIECLCEIDQILKKKHLNTSSLKYGI